MKIFLKINIFILLLISLFLKAFSQEELFNKYAEGQLAMKVKIDMFNFPLEIYGAFISFKNDKIKIDSVVYQKLDKKTRITIEEKIIPLGELKISHPEISKKIQMNIPLELISLFKKFKVY